MVFNLALNYILFKNLNIFIFGKINFEKNEIFKRTIEKV